MTDTERERIKAICEVAGVSEIDDLSDGFHTFRQLYYQRMMLFAAIVKQNRDKAWKSLRHEDGDLCFGGGWFIVGIDTPEGSYTYHYESNFYSLFECEELERGKHWDGHTEKDVTRLLSLPSAQPDAPDTNVGDIISRQAAVTEIAKFMLEYGGENEKRERDALHRAANGIKALPSVQPERQWIPCSERLPEDYTNVLVWLEYFRYGDYNCLYQTYGIGDYSTKYDSWMINHETGWHKLRVIAWMPLPESYKERPEE